MSEIEPRGKPNREQLDELWTALGWKKEQRDCVGIVMYETPQTVVISPGGGEQFDWPALDVEKVLYFAVPVLWARGMSISVVADGLLKRFHSYVWHDMVPEPSYSEESQENPGLAAFWAVYDALAKGVDDSDG
jgi:hypothetical protein